MKNLHKLDVIRSFLQFYGNVKLNNTTLNYDGRGGVSFSGYKENGELVKFSLDKSQVEAVFDCNTISEIHDCFIEMEFFPLQEGRDDAI